MTSYNEPAFRLSKYIEGYYCKDEGSINCIKSERTRALLNVLSKSFPLGRTEADLQQHEDIKDIIAPGTVQGSLVTLRESRFIKTDKRKIRSQKTNRLVSNHLFENMNSVSNEYFNYDYEFAPGYVKYDPSFLQAWNKYLVEKKDEDEIYPLLVKILRKAFTKIEGSNNPMLKELKPRTESQDGKKMNCTNCGTNHEARDFIRAVLLRLIDQLEINEVFFDFMNEKHFFDKENTTHRAIFMKSKEEATITQKQLRTSETYSTIKPEREIKEHKEREIIKLRILSIEKDTGEDDIPFIAITADRKFMHCRADSTMLTDDMISDSMIECIPSELFDSDDGYYLNLWKDDSYISTIDDDESFPKLHTIESQIWDVKVLNTAADFRQDPYFLEVTVLQKPERIEMPRENGETVPLTYTIIGDTTGQIKLQEYYDSAISKLSIGDRIKVIGADSIYGPGGEVTLNMDNTYGSIVKVANVSTAVQKVNLNEELYPERGTVKVQRKQVKGEIKVSLDKLEFFKDRTEAYITIFNYKSDDELQLSESGSKISQNNKKFALTQVRPRNHFPFIKPNIPPRSFFRTGVIKFEPIDHTQSNAKFQFKINRKPLHNSYDFAFDVSILRINKK